MSTTITTKRRRLGSILASTVLVGSVFALSGAQSASAAPVTLTYRLTGTMEIAGTPLELPAGSTWTGTIDRATGKITNGKSSIPDLEIPESETVPFPVTVSISDAVASTGTVSATGALNLNVSYRASLGIAGCEIGPISASLSTDVGVPLDKGNTYAIAGASGFTVPAIPGACPIAELANAALGLPTTESNIQLTLQGAPAAPKGTAKAGKKQVTFAWKPGVNPSGEPITGYTIRYRQGSGKWKSGGNVAATAKSKTFKKLKPGKTYTFQVQARNAVGIGAWSTPVSAKPKR